MKESTAFAKEEFLIQRFRLFDDLHERLDAIISFGRRWPPLSPTLCIPGNRISECMSKVWVHGHFADGKFTVRGEAELPLIRGLAALLFAVYDGLPASALPPCGTAILQKLDIWEQLSNARQLGLCGIEKKIRRDYQATRENS